jgi:hypothetical protein
MNLGHILAIALPIVAGATSGGGSAAASNQSTSTGKAEGFISSGAKAFLEAQGVGGKDRRPFQKAAPTAARPRSVTELTRGTAVGTVTPMAPTDPVQFQMPLYRSVLENLQRSARNTQVREMLDRYSIVQPTKAVGQGQKVQMTEVNV